MIRYPSDLATVKPTINPPVPEPVVEIEDDDEDIFKFPE
jgi:hypothetical protein